MITVVSFLVEKNNFFTNDIIFSDFLPNIR